MNLVDVARQFDLHEKILSIRPVKAQGLHETYLVDGEKNKYTMQRINTSVVSKPEVVMRNVLCVSRHLRQVVEKEPPSEASAVLCPVALGGDDTSLLARTGAGTFRMYYYVEGVPPQPGSLEHAAAIGYGFGRFLRRSKELPPQTLEPTRPFAHDVLSMYEQLDASIAADPFARVQSARGEIHFLKQNKSMAKLIGEGVRRREFPQRVVHGNVRPDCLLLHQRTHTAFCVTDLDAVAPGYALYDYGELIRSTAYASETNARGEEERILDLEKARALTTGYLAGARDVLTPLERELMPLGALNSALEMALLYLISYLGEQKRKKPAQEALLQARQHIQLAGSIQRQYDRFEEMIEEIEDAPRGGYTQ